MVETERPELRLARYLKEFVGLRTKTVKDVEKYDNVTWVSKLPRETECRSGARMDDWAPGAAWLEVRKQVFEAAAASSGKMPYGSGPWVKVRKFSPDRFSTRIPKDPVRTGVFPVPAGSTATGCAESSGPIPKGRVENAGIRPRHISR